VLRLSQLVTLGVGLVAVVVASRFERVLDAILYAYSFMVSGLFVPTLGALFSRRSSTTGAFWAMLVGGGTTVLLQLDILELPASWGSSALDPSLLGIACSCVVFVVLSVGVPDGTKGWRGKA
jgi:SSS family solute:Na+ symporter